MSKVEGGVRLTPPPSRLRVIIFPRRVKARANECNMLCQHVGHNVLRSFVHNVGLCCMMLAYVACSLKPVKLFAQHMQTFLLFSGDR